jgi:hypothetical protein
LLDVGIGRTYYSEGYWTLDKAGRRIVLRATNLPIISEWKKLAQSYNSRMKDGTVFTGSNFANMDEDTLFVKGRSKLRFSKSAQKKWGERGPYNGVFRVRD